MARRPAQPRIQYRPRLSQVVITLRGKVIHRTKDHDDAQAFMRGWNQTPRETLETMVQEFSANPAPVAAPFVKQGARKVWKRADGVCIWRPDDKQTFRFVTVDGDDLSPRRFHSLEAAIAAADDIAPQAAEPALASAADVAADIPAYTAPVWVDGKVTNYGETPLWSGKGAPPAIGAVVTCDDKARTQVMITGYAIEGGWLMAQGYRVAEPAKRGNLAGIEIHYPEPVTPAAPQAAETVRASDHPDVIDYLARNELGDAPKPFAIVRRDRLNRPNVFTWHSSESAAKRAIYNREARRPVR